jgi:hypothetical protein
MALREALHCEASPSAAIIDSRSLKAAEKGEPRAGAKRTQWVTTPGKKVKGRKLHALVDVESFPCARSPTPPAYRIATARSWFSRDR